jgi:N-methylhydantoinase A
MGKVCIGIDTGGTFTDLVAVDIDSERYFYHKVPTITADPAQGVVNGVSELLERNSLRAGDVEFLVLGTTLATNAVLEGRWASTGVITTRGFRDVIELARQRRPHYFNLDIPKPLPPAPRDCRLEVSERIAFDGAVVSPLIESEVQDAVDELKKKSVEAVAVCFLHAYANPSHEEKVRAIVNKQWPGIYVCTSSEVLSEFREYERFATATVNASLMPIMDRYMERFKQGIADIGINCSPRVMQSNGGAVSPETVKKFPINTFFSGPAGGVISSAAIGHALDMSRVIAFDMGGTSTDVCLIRNGEPAKKSERQMGGIPVRTRTLDIHTIGAGGGSIAWMDAGGLLKVGPQSAGAYPGPAVYGRGGERPTVTDANAFLGRLSPTSLLGGEMAMYPERAQKAISSLAEELGVDMIKAAAGIIEIVNVNMMGAVRVISIEQGEDPRDFTLIAFGGAGPLHAAYVARNMGMSRVLVPPRPGLLSAMGLLHADTRADFSLTRLLRAENSNIGALNLGYELLNERGKEWLRIEGVGNAKFEWFVDLRYYGQNYELMQEVKSGKLNERSLAELIDSFHNRHKDFYGYDMPAHPVEIVHLRLVVSAKSRLLPEQGVLVKGAGLKDAQTAVRDAWFPERGYVSTPVYDRSCLPIGIEISGPAIIEQMDTTTVVPPDAIVSNDDSGYLRIELAQVFQVGSE